MTNDQGALMNNSKRDAYSQARKELFGIQGRIIGVLVLFMALVAWWKQGYLHAIIGGVALYIFLMTLLIISNYVEGRRHR